MKLNITHKEANESLHRTHITATLYSGEATPKRTAIADALAEQLKADRNMVIVDTIQPAFGEPKATITARIYTNAETMSKCERANLIEKNAVPKEQPQETEE